MAGTDGLQGYHYALLAIGWLGWSAPFFPIFIQRKRPKAQTLDRRARWGIVLQGLGYSLVWQGAFWTRSPALWRVALSVLFLALACVLSWTSTRTLGRQWRVDAGLNADHGFVRAGAYRVVRHPIYTSMLCLLLGTGFLIARLALLLPATILCMIGTEIRVRIEDRLLAARFGDRFHDYRRSVGAYVPFLR